MKKTLFCFGVGFSGLETLLQAQGAEYEVSGCVRTQKKADYLNEKFDVNVITVDDLSKYDFSKTTHILMSIPPVADGGASYSAFAPFVQKSSNLQWFGYLSTTGVYGDKKGGWVNEMTPTNPSGQRGQVRVDSEKYWASQCDVIHIFRLPGIYGSGRSALDTVVRDGAVAVDKSGQVFSRIHKYDIAQTVLASMESPRAGAIYNVVDNLSCSPIEPLHYACALLSIDNVPVVKFEDADLTEMAKSFYCDNKRVENTLIKQELGVVLKYANYKEGLQAIFDEQKS